MTETDTQRRQRIRQLTPEQRRAELLAVFDTLPEREQALLVGTAHIFAEAE